MQPVETTQAPTVIFRPAAERFHSRLDWLDSWHSFSFAGHVDPNWMGFGPLRVINDDTIAAGKGFGMHPHRDMEIITVMVEGELSHKDSIGHSAVIHAGEVQRMSAGTGITHSEINRTTEPCRLLQIWIEPEKQGIPTAYEQKSFPIDSQWTPLIAPEGNRGAMRIARSVHLWRARPNQGSHLTLPATGGSLLWLQVINGTVNLNGSDAVPKRLQQGDGLGFHRMDAVIDDLSAAEAEADVLLFALR